MKSRWLFFTVAVLGILLYSCAGTPVDDVPAPIAASVEEPEEARVADNSPAESDPGADSSEKTEDSEIIEEPVSPPPDKKPSKKGKTPAAPDPVPEAESELEPEPEPEMITEDTDLTENSIDSGNPPEPEDNPGITESSEDIPEDRENETPDVGVSSDIEAEAGDVADVPVDSPGKTSIPDNPLLGDDVPYQAAIEPDFVDPDTVDSIDTDSEAIKPVEAGAADQAVEPAGTETHVTVELIEPDETVMPDPAESAAAPTRWLGGPGEFSVLLEGQGWVFRSDLSTPGSWRFLSRDTEGEATRFSFIFEEQGDWNLVFERQDLSSGGSERVIRTVRVGDEDGPIIENGPLSSEDTASISGDMPDDPAERNEAARIASEEGRSGEALSYWEKDAHRDDDAGRAARAALMEEAARSAAVVPLVTWLPRYLEDGADSDVLAAALDVLENQAGYADTSAILIEALAEYENDPRRAEWLYRLARLLEEPGESRDLDRSAALYRQVVDGWPLSEWRDLSEERLAWLRRYYFRVR